MNPNDAHPNRKSKTKMMKSPPNGPQSPPWIVALFLQNPKIIATKKTIQKAKPMDTVGDLLYDSGMATVVRGHPKH